MNARLQRSQSAEEFSIIRSCGQDCPAKNAIGIPVGKILKEEGAAEIMRNTCIIGAFAKIIGIEWGVA